MPRAAWVESGGGVGVGGDVGRSVGAGKVRRPTWTSTCRSESSAVNPRQGANKAALGVGGGHCGRGEEVTGGKAGAGCELLFQKDDADGGAAADAKDATHYRT